MPKSNVVFWATKFAENIERDRLAENELARMGWRVMVVWECELVKNTVETVGKVASWLRQGDEGTDDFLYNGRAVDRDELLAVAEEKVRYRMATYDEKPKPSGSGSPED